jgi:hypothetical protein
MNLAGDNRFPLLPLLCHQTRAKILATNITLTIKEKFGPWFCL